MDYKKMHEFYLTSNSLTRKEKKIEHLGNQTVLKSMKSKKIDIHSHSNNNIVQEKNIFKKKFLGPQTVRDTIKFRIHSRFQ